MVGTTVNASSYASIEVELRDIQKRLDVLNAKNALFLHQLNSLQVAISTMHSESIEPIRDKLQQLENMIVGVQ